MWWWKVWQHCHLQQGRLENVLSDFSDVGKKNLRQNIGVLTCCLWLYIGKCEKREMSLKTNC